MYTVFVSFFTTSPPPPPSQWYQYPQSGPVPPSYNLILQKKRKITFCLFKIATQGASLWLIHVYMYYSPICFTSSIFLFLVLKVFRNHTVTMERIRISKHFMFYKIELSVTDFCGNILTKNCRQHI
jgi:hypothetical protein